VIEIPLQPPALEPRALVGEHGDDGARFDPHVALARVADQGFAAGACRRCRCRGRRFGGQRAPGVLVWDVGEAVDVPATGLPVAAARCRRSGFRALV
jgi:hypothetical protein